MRSNRKQRQAYPIERGPAIRSNRKQSEPKSERTHEGQAGEAAEREALLPPVHHQVDDLAVLLVDLV